MKLLVRVLYVWPATALSWLGIQARRVRNAAACSECAARRNKLQQRATRYIDRMTGG